MNGGGLLSRKVERKIKRCLDKKNIIYKDVHINTHVYTQWNLRTMDTLGVSHLSFVERLSLYTIAIQLSLNQYTKNKGLVQVR